MKVKKTIWVGLCKPGHSEILNAIYLKVATFNKEDETDEFGALMLSGHMQANEKMNRVVFFFGGASK